MNPSHSDAHTASTPDREREALQWFDGLRAGDEAAFEALFRAYAGSLYAFAYSYVGSSSTAEELVQDLFARLWERRATLEPPRSVYSYLFSATRNGAEQIMDSPSESPQERDFDAQVLAEALDVAVRELPARCREVFILARESRLTHAQIAAVLRIAPKTVQVHMGRALALLRVKLAPWLRAD
jgi:RNA polymerase sigma-70 factor (ECF subfamily)